VKVEVTLTKETGKFFVAFNEIKLKGEGHFSTSIKIAQLALKHRVNKS
jgi:hypothetical protein